MVFFLLFRELSALEKKNLASLKPMQDHLFTDNKSPNNRKIEDDQIHLERLSLSQISPKICLMIGHISVFILWRYLMKTNRHSA